MVDNRTRDAALDLVGLGYPVFPIAVGKKRPATAHGLLDATVDPDQIEAWWGEEPSYNLALRTDGLLVLDLDGAENPWLGDEERAASLADAPCQVTANQGLHFFFRQPAGKAWRNTAGKLAAKVDTRANGGYVLLPPSVLDGDRGYAWRPGYELACAPEDLPEPPPWLTEMLDAEAAGKLKAPETADHSEEPWGEGVRNSRLASAGGRLRRRGWEEEELAAYLLGLNLLRCKPPLPPHEVLAIAKSLCRYEPDQVASYMEAEGLWLPAAEPAEEEGEEEPVEEDGPGTKNFPEDLLNVPGFLGDVVAYNLRTAHRPQPVLALSGALALLSVLTGRKIIDTYGTHTNLYLMALAPSGAGKDHARRINQRLLTWGNDQSRALMGPETISSSAGVVAALHERPVLLFQVDEIGRFLKTLRSPEKSPHLYGVITELLRLFTSAGQEFTGTARADMKQSRPIRWPHAVLYGTTLPGTFWDSLTMESLVDGFAARLLVFEAPGFVRRQRPEGITDAPPESLLAQVRAWCNLGLLHTGEPNPVKVEYSPEADRLILEREEEWDDLGGTPEGQEEGMEASWRRAAEMARRLAVLHAASRGGPTTRLVDLPAAEWGCRMVAHLTGGLLARAANRVADTEHGKVVLEARRYMSKVGSCTMTKLCRKFRGWNKRTREDVLEALQLAGEVRISKITTNGRPTTRLTWIAKVTT